ncbi:MAG: metallophosphoesterase [Verrucomicrobia bacterium]|nr:metallophosphoesterase [Verrucomicrobiota bacterium]
MTRCFTALLFLACTMARAADFPGTSVLGRPTNHSIAVNLLAPSALSTYLEFGTQPGNYPGQIEPVSLVANSPQEVTIDGLTANTRYFYRLRFRAAGATAYDAGPEYAFMTSRSPGSTFVFGVQGDSHPERAGQMFNAALYTRMMQTVAADAPDLFFTLGDDFSVDTINQANPAAVTRDQVINRYVIQRPYLGVLGRTVPIFLVNGNHEQAARYLLNGTPNSVAVWAQNARNAYYAQPAPDDFYTGNTEQIPFVSGPLRNFFAFTWGDALFVTLDPYWGSPVVVDNDFLGGPKTANAWSITHGDLQYNWLKATLEQSRARYKFVFAHHVMGTQRGGIDVALKYEWGGQNANGSPGFAANRPTWARPIHQLMADNQVTIFFQGHDHIFVHQQLDGVTYQSLGNPADNNYSLFNDDAYATGERFPNSGYARVTVTPDQGVKVDYVRTYLPADEGPGKVHGSVTFSYIAGLPQGSTPVIAVQPKSQAVSVGQPVTFSVSANASLPLTYQWQLNGVNLVGATTAVLGLPSVRATDVGAYTVVVKTSAGSVTSATANLVIGTSRLANLSVRSTAGTGSDTLIVGAVVGPGDNETVLIRGIGPGLAQFGVTGALPDPVLTLNDNRNAVVATNDDWARGTNANQTAVTAGQVGAFALTNTALDSALLTTLAPGSYSAVLTGKNNATGVALIEAYDASTQPTAARLVNMSARTRVGTGAAILIAGFAIKGDAPKQVLLRAIGPTLAGFGVTGVLADPQLALFRQGVAAPLQQNDNWLASPNAAQIGLAAAQVGAFALPANSHDSALLVTLEPGTYSAQISGVGDTAGVALVEIYEVP